MGCLLWIQILILHYTDIIMGTIASQITSLTIVYSTIYSDADQRKYQNSASPAFVRGIHRRPVNSPHKWPVTRKMFPFDDLIMFTSITVVMYAISCHIGPRYNSTRLNIDGLEQDCSISSALAMQILQSCTKPSIYKYMHLQHMIQYKCIWCTWQNGFSKDIGIS